MSILTFEARAYRTAEEVFAVLRGFADRSLPRERWTHAAHLTVALWHLLQYDWPEAVSRVREGIKGYNAAHGIVTTPTGGYHETLTLFWMRAVRAFLETGRNEGRSLVALANSLVASADKNLPLRHYSRELLFSVEARTRWVEPDLRPLPWRVSRSGAWPAASSSARRGWRARRRGRPAASSKAPPRG